MAKKLILAGMLCMALTFSLGLSGCASSPLTKNFLSQEPVQVISKINTESTKVSELTSVVVLGAFGNRAFPSIADTAKAGDITKIATVEYYKKPWVLGLWTIYYTIVTGD